MRKLEEQVETLHDESKKLVKEKEKALLLVAQTVDTLSVKRWEEPNVV